MDMDNRVGIDRGSRGWAGQGTAMGEIGTTLIEQQFFFKSRILSLERKLQDKNFA